MRGKKSSENSTIIRLRETPFKTAAEMNAEENRIMREEWEILERARRRRLLFKKEQFREIVAPTRTVLERDLFKPLMLNPARTIL